MISIALERQAAAMESEQRRTMADGYNGRAGEPLGEEAVERCFRRLVERGCGLIQKEIIRRLQNGTSNAETLLLAEREHAVPVGFLLQPLRKLGQADSGNDFR